MTTRPHDVTDLYLSPVLLEVDRRLADLAGQTARQLELFSALSTDREARDSVERKALLLDSLTHLVDLHGWSVAWDARGLRVSHGNHAVVLGVPDSVREYLASAPSD